MINLIILFSVILGIKAEAQSIGKCGNDLNCLYGEQQKILEEKELKSRKEVEEFRNLQLEIESQKLEEMRKQTSLLEEQDARMADLLNRMEEMNKPKEESEKNLNEIEDETQGDNEIEAENNVENQE